MAQTIVKLEFLRKRREACIMAQLLEEAKVVDKIIQEQISCFYSSMFQCEG